MAYFFLICTWHSLLYIKIAKGIFHLNYFPCKCNSEELESFHNEVVRLHVGWLSCALQSKLTYKNPAGTKRQSGSLMHFSSVFEINSWRILNHSTRATKHKSYFSTLKSIPSGTQLDKEKMNLTFDCSKRILM